MSKQKPLSMRYSRFFSSLRQQNCTNPPIICRMNDLFIKTIRCAIRPAVVATLAALCLAGCGKRNPSGIDLPPVDKNGEAIQPVYNDYTETFGALPAASPSCVPQYAVHRRNCKQRAMRKRWERSASGLRKKMKNTAYS